MRGKYKLQSNNYNDKLRQMVKILSIILMLFIFMSSFAGCVSVPVGSNSHDNPLWWEADDAYHSKLKDDGTNLGSGLVFLNKKVDKEHAVWTDFSVSTGILRELAIMMHDSIFKTAYDVSSDPWVEGTVESFALEPSTLIVNVSDITADHLVPPDDVTSADDEQDKTLAKIINIMQGCAAAILIAMWSMGFISQIVNEKFTMETLLKTLMQLLCGILIITNATTIVTCFVDLGTAIVEQVGESTNNETFSNLKQDVVKSLSSVQVMGFGVKIFSLSFAMDPNVIDVGGPIYAMLLMALPFFAQLLLAYKICSMMIMRMLELVMRITFAPIPLAFSAQNGFSHEATRYLRSTLACALQPALMLVGCAFVGVISEVVLKIFSVDTGAGGPSGLLGSVAMCISYFILSAFIGETKGLAQEIIAR